MSSTPLYAKIKYYGQPANCEESTECSVDGKGKLVYYCDTHNADYCKDFKNAQKEWADWEKSKNPNKFKKIPSPPYYYQGCYFDSKCSSKKPVPPKPPSGSCSTDIKACCEHMDGSGKSNACPQMPQCCGIKCIDAEYGFGKAKDPSTCYVGDKDPCNIMDSGEDLVPNTCFNSCCPGNYNGKIPPKPKPAPPKPTVNKCYLSYDPNLYSKYKDGNGKIHCEKNSKYRCRWECSDTKNLRKVPVDKHYPGFMGCYETQQHCQSKK